MAEIDIITRVADLGSTALLAVILFFLWRDYRDQNAFIRDLLKDAEAERQALAAHVGIDIVQLKAEAVAYRARMDKGIRPAFVAIDKKNWQDLN